MPLPKYTRAKYEDLKAHYEAGRTVLHGGTAYNKSDGADQPFPTPEEYAGYDAHAVRQVAEEIDNQILMLQQRRAALVRHAEDAGKREGAPVRESVSLAAPKDAPGAAGGGITAESLQARDDEAARRARVAAEEAHASLEAQQKHKDEAARAGEQAAAGAVPASAAGAEPKKADAEADRAARAKAEADKAARRDAVMGAPAPEKK